MAIDFLCAFIGLLLLTLGRRLFWFFVAAVGMSAGIALVQQQMMFQPDWMVVLAGLAAGIIGALLALFFQKAAIVVAGLAAGGIIAARLMVLLGYGGVPWVSLCGAIIGAIVLYRLFDGALIVVSSLVGADLIVQSVNLSSQAGLLLFGVLITAGIIFQSLMWQSVKIKR